jgi:hypothetical protein
MRAVKAAKLGRRVSQLNRGRMRSMEGSEMKGSLCGRPGVRLDVDAPDLRIEVESS